MYLIDVINLVKSLRNDRRGVTALEYGLIAGAIALAIITAVGTIGTKVGGVFNNIAAANW